MGPARGPRRSRAPAGPRGRQGRRRDRGALARRRRRAGAGAGRVAGAGRPRSSRARARAARRARRDSAAARRRRAGGARRDPRSGRSRSRPRGGHRPRGPDRRRLAGPGGRLRPRKARRGHPARGDPRDRRGDGELARRRLVHRAGPSGRGLGTLALEPGEPSDEPRREHRRHPRGRRPQLHDARCRPLLERARAGLRLARRREALARLPASRADLHRRARRRPEPARGVPSTRDGDAPEPVPRVDRRTAAGRCVRLGGGGRSGGGGEDGVGGRAGQPYRQRRLRGDVHGRRARGVDRPSRRRRRARTPASRSCRRAAGSPRRCGRRAIWRASASGRRSSTSSTSGYGHYHWVHAINNTALVAAALYAFDGDFSGAIGAAVQGAGTPTRTAPRSARSSVPRSAPPGSTRAGRLRSTDGSRARCPGFDGIALDELVRANARGRRRHRRRHDHRGRASHATRSSPRPIDLPTAVPLEGPLDALDAAKIFAAPDDPGEWPAWRACAAAAGATRPPRASRTTAAPTSVPEFAWTRRLLLGRPRLALGRAALRPRRRALHAGPVLRRRGARVRQASTASCSGTPIP